MKSPNNRAFTLTELMLAVAILMVAITGLLATFVYCILLNQSNNNLVIATNDAQYVLEQIKGLAYTDTNSYIDNYDPHTFTNLNNEHAIPHRHEGTNIKEITVNITWDERQAQRNFSLTTKIANTQ